MIQFLFKCSQKFPAFFSLLVLLNLNSDLDSLYFKFA